MFVSAHSATEAIVICQRPVSVLRPGFWKMYLWVAGSLPSVGKTKLSHNLIPHQATSKGMGMDVFLRALCVEKHVFELGVVYGSCKGMVPFLKNKHFGTSSNLSHAVASKTDYFRVD